jgi:hypothetical protein
VRRHEEKTLQLPNFGLSKDKNKSDEEHRSWKLEKQQIDE